MSSMAYNQLLEKPFSGERCSSPKKPRKTQIDPEIYHVGGDQLLEMRNSMDLVKKKLLRKTDYGFWEKGKISEERASFFEAEKVPKISGNRQKFTSKNGTKTNIQSRKFHFTKPGGVSVASLKRHKKSKMEICKTRLWKHLRNLVPFLILVVYSALGGWMFMYIESRDLTSQNETLTTLIKAKNRSRSAIIDLFDRATNETDFDSVSDEIETILQSFAENLGLQPQEYYEWGYWSSVFYAGSLYTSIGYGNNPPRTAAGKVITCVYAVVGIPLLLYTLSQLGKFMCYSIWTLYTLFMIYVVHRCCGCSKCCRKEKADLSEFPFSIAIFITIGWMFLCAVIFCQWEDWDYATSFYFFFQSLTTIGLGDVMPQHPRYLVFSFFLIIMGLAMVSMCWNLIQMKLDSLVKTTMDKIRVSLVSGDEEVTGLLLDAEDDEYSTEIAAERSIHGIVGTVGGDSSWLFGLLGDNRKEELISQWEHHARHRNKRIQTENLTETQEVQATVITSDATTDSDINLIAVNKQTVPLREVHRRVPVRNSDDFLNLLQELGYILHDCQDIVKHE